MIKGMGKLKCSYLFVTIREIRETIPLTMILKQKRKYIVIGTYSAPLKLILILDSFCWNIKEKVRLIMLFIITLFINKRLILPIMIEL